MPDQPTQAPTAPASLASPPPQIPAKKSPAPARKRAAPAEKARSASRQSAGSASTSRRTAESTASEHASGISRRITSDAAAPKRLATTRISATRVMSPHYEGRRRQRADGPLSVPLEEESGDRMAARAARLRGPERCWPSG